MDLFLMDAILKGKIPEAGRILDVGCGEGRNAIYFLRNGYEYNGWDLDVSRIHLVEYLAKNLEGVNASFRVTDFRTEEVERPFDFIICSRVLHFARDEEDFNLMINAMGKLLKKSGSLYFSMDSVVGTTIAKEQSGGKWEFPDGKIRFSLTEDLYEETKKGFEEIEPLKTVIYQNERAQSFALLKKF